MSDSLNIDIPTSQTQDVTQMKPVIMPSNIIIPPLHNDQSSKKNNNSIHNQNPTQAENQKCSFHWATFILSSITATCLGLFINFFFVQKSNFGDPKVYFPCIFGFMLYIIYLFECYKADTKKYLRNINDIVDLENFMKSIKEESPKIVFSIECYHYETRTRTVTSTDSEGRSQTRYETYQEKVVTFRKSQQFKYTKWSDQTGIITGIGNSDITRLKLDKTLMFADKFTEDYFRQKRREFVNEYKSRDTHHSDSYELMINGFEKCLLVQKKEISKPCCMNIGWYTFWSLILLSWPYRLWFSKLTRGKKATIKKQIQVNK